MAGAFTHISVSEIARSKRKRLNSGLRDLLNNYYYFLWLGSVSPDLPYLSPIADQAAWADAMHYTRTNSIENTGYRILLERWPSKIADQEAAFVWLMGYVSHVITDVTIHPVVQQVVGAYHGHEDEHRECEMTQDSIIFNEMFRHDILDAELLETIKYCERSDSFPRVMDYWKTWLTANYTDMARDPLPRLWFELYVSALSKVSGDSQVAVLFKHIGQKASTYVYKTSWEIKTKYPNEYKKYYESVALPSGGVGSFLSVFNKAIDNVLQEWNTIYDSITRGAALRSATQNWNLDTGVDSNSRIQSATFWT